MSTALRALFVAHQQTADRFTEALRQAGYTGSWQVVQIEDEYWAALKTAAFDVVIFDDTLPWRAAVARALHGLNVPLIAAGQTPDVETAVACIKSGADDYTGLDGLAQAVSRALAAAGTPPQAGESPALERALEDERRLNTTKNRVLSCLSHDLRTPLSVILTTSELLQRYLDRLSEERRQGYFDAIRNQIKIIDQRLDDISAVVRAETGRLEYAPTILDLAQLCQDVADETRLMIGSGYQIGVQTTGDLAHITGDPRLLRMALRNLLANAVKFSSPGQEIRLEAGRRDERAVFVRVSDEGMGIPEADQLRLFEPYYRASNAQDMSGAGIGLRLVRCVADLHGGSISFTSREGAGSAFMLELPLVAQVD